MANNDFAIIDARGASDGATFILANGQDAPHGYARF